MAPRLLSSSFPRVGQEDSASAFPAAGLATPAWNVSTPARQGALRPTPGTPTPAAKPSEPRDLIAGRLVLGSLVTVNVVGAEGREPLEGSVVLVEDQTLEAVRGQY